MYQDRAASVYKKIREKSKREKLGLRIILNKEIDNYVAGKEGEAIVSYFYKGFREKV